MSTSPDVVVETPRGHRRAAHVVSAKLIASLTGVDERLTVELVGAGVELTVLASDCEQFEERAAAVLQTAEAKF
ncbi:hypothetical protein C5C07_15470 [Haloferax sp. Atlit-4N]|uniref:hypothetical protein n=1 Tax=Haloferax sp. Atlit-4N TaxID=2077206 RepID=UPI000E25CF3C|nr:hypothetical protein [Haloferax sp. Atlit-4N]RDZ53133.1 hypothetical protein C5C07_15470 [Haloferax sp. Atlit-4N]